MRYCDALAPTIALSLVVRVDTWLCEVTRHAAEVFEIDIKQMSLVSLIIVFFILNDMHKIQNKNKNLRRAYFN